MTRANFTFNSDLADARFLETLEAYKSKRLIYSGWHHTTNTAPQKRFIPHRVKSGTVEHLRFLFFAGLTTLRNVSDDGYRLMADNYERSRWLFLQEIESYNIVAERYEDGSWLFGPELHKRVANKSDTQDVVTKISAELKEMGFGHNIQWAPYWRDCSLELWNNFNGDPVALMNSFQSISDYNSKKDRGELKLSGYGPKLMSLYSIFLQELGLIPGFDDAFPVDVHIQQFCLSTGIATSDQLVFSSDPFAEFLRVKITDWCKLNGACRVELSHALWFLGSKVCTRCRRRDVTELCPVEKHCQGRFPTEAYWKQGKWDLRPPDELQLFLIKVP